MSLHSIYYKVFVSFPQGIIAAGAALIEIIRAIAER